MSFSILIPVYNVDILPLVEQLHKQASLLTQEFEIILIDDCSDLSNAYINRKVVDLGNISFHLLSTNIGRSQIRNLLFEKAKYDKCIIMDCDIMPQNDDFLIKYLTALTETNVVVGGHTYSQTAPEDKNKYLHWKYGKTTEVQAIDKRKNRPYASFMTNCFASYKSTFEKVKFDETIQGYGHEDTLFGIALENQNISILHIDNPVIHLGLEDKDEFLRKQKEAVSNLKKLTKNEAISDALAKKSSLIRASKNPIFKFGASLFHNWAKKEINKENPNLKALQILKLNWFNQ